LSTGDARAAIVPANTNDSSSLQDITGPREDLHLRRACRDAEAAATGTANSTSSGGGSLAGQTLLDVVALEFDLTPAVSGPLVFSYVFGSEEYPEFAVSFLLGFIWVSYGFHLSSILGFTQEAVAGSMQGPPCHCCMSYIHTDPMISSNWDQGW
jgi:hypothetical protein